jgi:hypothetical protein
MAFGTILAGLSALLKLAPQLLEVAKLLGQAYQRGERFVVVKIELGAYDKGAKTSKEEKDTSGLEDLFHPKTPHP